MIKKIKNWIRNLEGIQGYSSSGSISMRVGKHYCPMCHGLLQVIRKSRIVNSESEEAKDFNFSGVDGGYMIGNVKFTWDVCFCEQCNHEISTGDMYRYEREQRKLKRNE